MRLLGRPYTVFHSSSIHACIVESLTSELILYLKCSGQHHGWRYEMLYMYDGRNTQNGRIVNPHNAIDSIDSLTVRCLDRIRGPHPFAGKQCSIQSAWLSDLSRMYSADAEVRYRLG